MNTEILNANFDIENVKYPKNIYAVRISDEMDTTYDITVQHNGYCPNISTEREQSNYNDYLSNLHNTVIDEFFKTINKQKPKVYSNKLEVITNSKGDLYYLSKSVS